MLEAADSAPQTMGLNLKQVRTVLKRQAVAECFGGVWRGSGGVYICIIVYSFFICCGLS